jgi:ABC-2 type transport system ATP-binding protein
MSSNGETVVEAADLTKVYQSGSGLIKNNAPSKVAVDKVSFEIKRGQIFGLLGPNGAGKTTTIKMLSTLLIPTSGKATILGYDVEKSFMEIRKRINLVSGGERGLYYRVSGRQNLRFFSDLYRISSKVKERRVDELLELVGLEKAADQKVEEYSRGMKQRLHIARGLVNDPEVLFLDEPTIGLDPEISLEVRSLIRGMSKKGRALMLTTHNMREAEELCDYINIISHGKIVGKGTVADLKDAVKDKAVVEVQARAISPQVIEAVRSLEGVVGVTATTETNWAIMRIQVDDGREMIPSISSKLDGCHLMRISNEEPTLEDVYLNMVNKDA